MKPVLDVRFFATDTGTEPVREWPKDLSSIERKTMGEDIKAVQFGWPLGMSLVRSMGAGLWEVRIRLENRIARVLFVLDGSTMVLLHAFIKKQQETPTDTKDTHVSYLKNHRCSTFFGLPCINICRQF